MLLSGALLMLTVDSSQPNPTCRFDAERLIHRKLHSSCCDIAILANACPAVRQSAHHLISSQHQCATGRRPSDALGGSESFSCGCRSRVLRVPLLVSEPYLSDVAVASLRSQAIRTFAEDTSSGAQTLCWWFGALRQVKDTWCVPTFSWVVPSQ